MTKVGDRKNSDIKFSYYSCGYRVFTIEHYRVLYWMFSHILGFTNSFLFMICPANDDSKEISMKIYVYINCRLCLIFAVMKIILKGRTLYNLLVKLMGSRRT